MKGVYGLPKCLGEDHRLCDYARRLLNYGAYTTWIQRLLVQVGTLISISILHKQPLTFPRLSTGMTPWQRLSTLPSLCSWLTSTIRCSKSTSSDWSILLYYSSDWFSIIALQGPEKNASYATNLAAVEKLVLVQV